MRYRRAPQRVLLGTARSRAGGVVKSLSALCCRVCNSVTRCARSVGSQVAQWWLGRVVRGNFDACVQRGRVCGRRSFTRWLGVGVPSGPLVGFQYLQTRADTFREWNPLLH